jgi:hypothetical protein
MGRSWCELQVAGECILGVNVAKLWCWWGSWLEELVVWQRWWLVMGNVIELQRWGWRGYGCVVGVG